MNSIRIRFTRGEKVKFISHLDLMKVFERAIRRSGLPIAYSKGFNPHPQMVFGLPLGVGMTSEGEYADFELVQEITPGRFMERLNESLPEDIRVTASAEKNTKDNIMASIAGADYIMELFTNELITADTLRQKVKELLSRDSIKVMKEGKGKDGRQTLRETEIRPLMLDVSFEEMRNVPDGYEVFQTAFVIKARFQAGSAANLRPELFIKALAEHAGIPADAVRIHRKALYIERSGRMADPLDAAVLS